MICTLLLAWVGAKLCAPWWFWAMLGLYMLTHLARVSFKIGRIKIKKNGDE